MMTTSDQVRLATRLDGGKPGISPLVDSYRVGTHRGARRAALRAATILTVEGPVVVVVHAHDADGGRRLHLGRGIERALAALVGSTSALGQNLVTPLDPKPPVREPRIQCSCPGPRSVRIRTASVLQSMARVMANASMPSKPS